MRILVERLEPSVSSKDKRVYYTFWVRFIDTSGTLLYISTAGWRYWPDTRKMGTPAINKGPGKGYFNTVQVPSEVYNIIQTQVEDILGLGPILEPSEGLPTAA